MCEYCSKLSSAATYSSKLSQYMLEDIERMMKTEDALLFSQADFPYIEPLLYFEPRVALPKPTRYYQGIRIDGMEMRQDWASGAMRSIGFKNGKIILLAKAVTRKIGEAEKLDHYFLVQLGKEELKISERNNEITIAFDGNVEGMNIKTRKMESHTLTFSFTHEHNEKAILPDSRIAASGIYGGTSRVMGKQAIMSRFENYSITVMHFAPHPLLLYSYKELGFESAMEFQKKVYDILKMHLL